MVKKDDNLDKESRRARLTWQCRRGMLELDLLLQGFISVYYEQLTSRELDQFNILLDYPDAILFDLLMGKSVTADQEMGSVIKKIRTAATS